MGTHKIYRGIQYRTNILGSLYGDCHELLARCSAFKWTPKGRHQRACAEGNPLTSCVSARPHLSFVKYVFVSFLACVAGVRNFKNLLLINQKIYVHGCFFVCYQYRGILYCNALPAFSLRDASCNVIDIEIMCRTFEKRDCSFVSDL